MPRETLWPRKNQASIVGNVNFDTRHEDRAVPAYDHAAMTGSADTLYPFIATAIETSNPSGNPRQYAFANTKCFYFEDGARTTDNTFADVVDGAVIAADASTPPLKKMYAGFGNSSSIKNAVRVLTTDTTPWTTTNAAGGAQFWLITKAGPDLYAMTNAGVVASVNDNFRISKCPAGNDPTLAASWGAGFSVGTPEWLITGLAAIGTSPVVGKPDGLYVWDDQTKRFENKMLHLIDSPHPGNGKGMRAVTNGVMYPTNDGKLYLFDGISITEVTPEKSITLTRDQGISRVTAIADNGDTVAIVHEAFQNTLDGQRAVNAGLKVITYIGGTFTDVTSTVTDGSLVTGAAMATWGAAANDRLYIGLNAPWEGALLRVTRQPNTATQSFATPSYSNGTTGTVAPFTSSFTAFTSGVDGTILGTAGVSLTLVGFPPSGSAGAITWTDHNAWDVMTSTSLQFGGSIGTLTRYWAVWAPAGGLVGMTNPTTIDEVEVVYSRAAPGQGVTQGILGTTNNYNFLHRYRSGCLTTVTLGKRDKTVGFTWSDVYALDMYGQVTAVAWTSAKNGSTTNGGQGLVLWGRFKQMVIAEGITRDPARTAWPMLVQYGTTKPGPLLDLAPGGIVLQNSLSLIKNRRKRVMINAFIIIGEYGPGQPNASPDKIDIHLQSDQIDIALYGEAQGLPAVIRGSQTTFGSAQRVYAYLAYQQGSQSRPQAPSIREVLIDYDEVDEEYDFPVAPDTASLPERT